MKIKMNTCKFRGNTDPTVLFLIALFLVIFALPVFFRGGNFNFIPFEAAAYFFALFLIIAWIRPRYLSYCIEEEKIIIRYPFKIKKRIIYIPFDEIKYVSHDQVLQRPPLYDNQDHFSVYIKDGRKVNISVWRVDREIDKILDFLRDSGLDVKIS